MDQAEAIQSLPSLPVVLGGVSITGRRLMKMEILKIPGYKLECLWCGISLMPKNGLMCWNPI